MKRQVKLFDPVIDDNELHALETILKSKSWADGSGSKQVRKFEEEFQKENNSDSSIAVNSGTAALYLALSMENIQNKEVILPSMSFVSTAHAIIAKRQCVPRLAHPCPPRQSRNFRACGSSQHGLSQNCYSYLFVHRLIQ